MSRSILLTGATGFLGSHLATRLLEEQYDVIIAKRSSSDNFRIKNIINDLKCYDVDEIEIDEVFTQKVDMIIHCATEYGRGKSDITSMLEANLMLPLKLLECGKKNGVTCFINTDTVLDKYVGDYSFSKYQFKEWLKLKSKDIICINMALEHFYGPFDGKTKFISNIIDKLLHNTLKIELTKGEQIRDFIYIDDIVSAYMTIIDNISTLSTGFHHYEIGTNHPITIKGCVELMKNISGNNSTLFNFGSIPYRENELMESLANTDKIRELGWKPQFSIEDGLRLTIERERENFI